MKRILTGGLLLAATSMPIDALASPVYACLQADNDAGGVGLGYLFDKTYAVEAHYRRSREVISHSGVTSDTSITATGLSVLASFSIRADGGPGYSVFAKAGYERQRKEEVYSFPISVTYNGTVRNIDYQTILGGGIHLQFSRYVGGRTGVELIGDRRSIYWAAIFRF